MSDLTAAIMTHADNPGDVATAAQSAQAEILAALMSRDCRKRRVNSSNAGDLRGVRRRDFMTFV